MLPYAYHNYKAVAALLIENGFAELASEIPISQNL